MTDSPHILSISYEACVARPLVNDSPYSTDQKGEKRASFSTWQ